MKWLIQNVTEFKRNGYDFFINVLIIPACVLIIYGCWVKHIGVTGILIFSMYCMLLRLFQQCFTITNKWQMYFDLLKYLDVTSCVCFLFYPGNDYIHAITSQAKYTLRVDLTAFNGSTAYATYTTFAVGAQSTNYELSVAGYDGTAG